MMRSGGELVSCYQAPAVRVAEQDRRLEMAWLTLPTLFILIAPEVTGAGGELGVTLQAGAGGGRQLRVTAVTVRPQHSQARRNPSA